MLLHDADKACGVLPVLAGGRIGREPECRLNAGQNDAHHQRHQCQCAQRWTCQGQCRQSQRDKREAHGGVVVIGIPLRLREGSDQKPGGGKCGQARHSLPATAPGHQQGSKGHDTGPRVLGDDRRDRVFKTPINLRNQRYHLSQIRSCEHPSSGDIGHTGEKDGRCVEAQNRTQRPIAQCDVCPDQGRYGQKVRFETNADAS